LLKSKTSLTADYLNGTRDRGARQAPQGLGKKLTVHKAPPTTSRA
jgi:hypothetical protein